MFVRLRPTTKLFYLPFSLPQNDEADDSKNKTASKMVLSPKSLAGPGYIILNCIRAMNIIGLLAVVAASVVMLVKTSTASKFFFFDAVSHVLTCVTGMFLLASELSLFRSYYARNWPLLSPAHGFVTLGLSMIVLGINMLGNLNKQATSQESLGMAFWQMVISSGIVIFIMGWVNVVASYVFRDRSQNITARQVRAKGAVAVHKTQMSSTTDSSSAPVLAQSWLPSPITPTKPSSPFRAFTSERRQSTLPSYHTASPGGHDSPVRAPLSPSSKYSRATDCSKKVFSFMGRRNRQSVGLPLPVNVHERPMEISSPIGINPQFAHLLRRPDSALHPSRTGDSDAAFRWRPVS